MPVTLHFFKLLDDRGPAGVLDYVVSFHDDVVRIVSPPNEGLKEAQRVLEKRGFNVEPIADQQAAAEAWEERLYAEYLDEHPER